MWRGGGRFVGESTRTRYNTGEGDRSYADRSNMESRRLESMNITRGTESTNAVPAMPGQGRPGQHFDSGTTNDIPYQLYVNIPLVSMAPATSASAGGDGVHAREHDRQPPPPYQPRAEQYVCGGRLVEREG